MKEKEKELQDLICSMKFTKVNEYAIQNKVFSDEIFKYKDLCIKNEQINISQQK